MFVRICSSCGDRKQVKNRLSTQRKYCNTCKYKDVQRNKSISLKKSGENHHFYNKTLDADHRKKISVGNKGKVQSHSTRKKISVARTGIAKPTRKGVILSEEVKTKIRIGGIEAYKQRHNGQIPIPRANPNACKLFSKLENEFKFNGIYASKSGHEFYIKELGYWVDYYEPNINLVIEFYERQHNRPARIKKDAIREDLIKKTLGCKFIVVWEFDTIEEIYQLVQKHIHN